MIVGTVAILLTLTQDKELPKPAELQLGEVVRVYERTMSRRGIFENILVLTPTKAFQKNGEIRHWLAFTPAQRSQLRAIFSSEPKGLRSKKRDKPMWPSSYDASDVWMSYRVGGATKMWTNYDYNYPEFDCPLTKFLDGIKTKLAAQPNE